MENKAPKEIFVNFKQKVFTADERFAKGYYDRPYTKYLSEESVKEMLAEKDREIEELDREEWINLFKNNSKEEILELLIEHEFPL